MKSFCWIAFFLIAGFAYADDLPKQIEDHFNIYLIRPERRSSGDKVIIKNDVASIYYWESGSKRKPDEVICDAYEYLLVGRTTYGKGAKEAFEKFGSINKIELIMYDYEFGTRRGEQTAEILPTQKMSEYLKIGVVRDSLMKKAFDRKIVKKMFADRQCSEIGKGFIDYVSLRDSYFEAKK